MPRKACRPKLLANLYLAMEHNLEIIPIINKIDLPSADVDRVLEEIDSELGLDPDTHYKMFGQRGNRHRRNSRSNRQSYSAAERRCRKSTSGIDF